MIFIRISAVVRPSPTLRPRIDRKVLALYLLLIGVTAIFVAMYVVGTYRSSPILSALGILYDGSSEIIPAGTCIFQDMITGKPHIIDKTAAFQKVRDQLFIEMEI